ncbi:MAG TPA: hypothetical protein VF060_25190 [Trebonia sp.]
MNRVNVALAAEAAGALDNLPSRTGTKKVTVVNRASPLATITGGYSRVSAGQRANDVRRVD